MMDGESEFEAVSYRHPVDKAMLNFEPDDDKIDGLLYEGIVEKEEDVVHSN